jgi:hypothetical protein
MAFQSLDLCGDTLVSAFVGEVDGNSPGGSRGIVRGFSPRSRSNLVRYLRGAVSEYRNFVTLTLPGEFCNADGKRHWRTLVERIRRMQGKQPGWSICWFMEFQRRGAMHFHAFTTHRIDKTWLANAWFEVVGSQQEAHRAVGTRVEALRGGRDAGARYAAKYAGKHEQKDLPVGAEGFGRFWGIVGQRSHVAAAVRITEAMRAEKTIFYLLEQIKRRVLAAIEGGRASKRRCAFATVYWLKARDDQWAVDTWIRLLNNRAKAFGEGIAGHVFNDAEVW